MPTIVPSSYAAEPLLNAIQLDLLPVMAPVIRERIVVARPKRKALVLPPTMNALAANRTGRRISVKHPQYSDRATRLAAAWPREQLRELRVPKLVFVVRGTTGLRLGDYILISPAGHGIFMPPGTAHPDGTAPHLDGLPPDSPQCDLLWLAPVENGLSCWMCHSHGHEHRGSSSGEKVFFANSQLLFYLHLLNEESCDPETFDQDLFSGLALVLLRSVARDIRAHRFFAQNVAWETRSLGGDPIARAEQYILTHLSRPLSIDEVARQAAMSRAQFTKRFREQTGASFLEYTNIQRLKRARELLLETDWTVAVIAAQVGYRSPEHFHRIFQQAEGMTPVAFRRNAEKS